MKNAVISTSLAIAALLPQTAPAQVMSRSVRYNDINLATLHGQRILESRIAVAVHHVCGDPDLRDLRAVIDSRNCRRTARASADNAMRLAIAAHGTRLAQAGGR